MEIFLKLQFNKDVASVVVYGRLTREIKKKILFVVNLTSEFSNRLVICTQTKDKLLEFVSDVYLQIQLLL